MARARRIEPPHPGHPDPLAPLLRLFEKTGRGWWSTSINFRRADRLVVVEGVRWTVHFNVHGVRMGGAPRTEG